MHEWVRRSVHVKLLRTPDMYDKIYKYEIKVLQKSKENSVPNFL